MLAPENQNQSNIEVLSIQGDSCLKKVAFGTSNIRGCMLKKNVRRLEHFGYLDSFLN